MNTSMPPIDPDIKFVSPAKIGERDLSKKKYVYNSQPQIDINRERAQ